MSLRLLDSWLAEQPIARKLDALTALIISLVTLVVGLQIVAAYEGLHAFGVSAQSEAFELPIPAFRTDTGQSPATYPSMPMM